MGSLAIENLCGHGSSAKGAAHADCPHDSSTLFCCVWDGREWLAVELSLVHG
jgi:hypothetical protein